jgi:hypothetical protein
MTLDTLAIYERLKAADLPEPAARAIAELFRVFVEERLVTREYFDLRMKEFEYKLKELEENTNLHFKALEENTNLRFKELEEHTNLRFKELEEHTNLRFKELEYKLKALEENTNLRLKELEERIRIQLASEIRGVETRLIRWIFAMGVATITVITALIKLLR